MYQVTTLGQSLSLPWPSPFSMDQQSTSLVVSLHIASTYAARSASAAAGVAIQLYSATCMSMCCGGSVWLSALRPYMLCEQAYDHSFSARTVRKEQGKDRQMMCMRWAVRRARCTAAPAAHVSPLGA